MENKAKEFRALHNGNAPLILPNVWDAGSARVIENAGAKAVATTSAGVCWAQGYADDAEMPPRLQLEVAKSILRVINVPLSVDVERGYSSDPIVVGENVQPLIMAGVSGINIEDGIDDPNLLAAKVEVIREISDKLGADLFINVRCDVFLRGLVDVDKSVDEVLSRAERYKKAGADGLFLPALADNEKIKQIVPKAGLIVNVMAWPGLADVNELFKLGINRVSAGSGIPQIIWKKTEDLAAAFLETGKSSPFMEGYMDHSKLQGLFPKN